MEKLAEEYRDAESEDMIEATHLENIPWDQVYVRQGRRQQLIPYELAARPDERETILSIAEDRKDLIEHLK